MSQQSLRQASVRAVTGTTGTYEEDWHSLFTAAGIAVGSFEERMLQWINTRLSSAYTEINSALAAFAAAESVDSFQALGSFTASSSSASDRVLFSEILGPLVSAQASAAAIHPGVLEAA